MKNRKTFLLIAFLLSSCVPVATATSTSTPTQTITPLPTATQTPSPTPTITPTPTPIGGGSEKSIFEYYKAAYEKSFPDLKGDIHVFTSNLDGTDLTPVTNGLKDINHIENISAGGQMVLVSSYSNNQAKGDLYLIYLDSPNSTPIKLASGLAWSRWPQAIFLDKTHIVYIGQGSKGYGFYTDNIDGTNPKKLGAPNAKYAGIVSSDKTHIYYEGITKKYFKDSFGILYAYGDFDSLWWINIDGSGQGKLESNGQQIIGIYAFSPDGKSIAWIPTGLEQGCSGGLGIFWTPHIRDGRYTKEVEKPSMFISRNSPVLGKIIDIAYVEDYVRRCNIMHVASLSNMDNDAKIPLIPPFDPAKDDFYYHELYDLTWWPDSSKILAYDRGAAISRYWWDGMTDYYPMALYEVSPMDINPKLTLVNVLSNSSVVQSSPGAWPHLVDSFNSFNFSPDGRQIMFAKHKYDNQGSMIDILNLETMNYVDDFSRNITPDFQIERVINIYWLP